MANTRPSDLREGEIIGDVMALCKVAIEDWSFLIMEVTCGPTYFVLDGQAYGASHVGALARIHHAVSV